MKARPVLKTCIIMQGRVTNYVNLNLCRLGHTKESCRFNTQDNEQNGKSDQIAVCRREKSNNKNFDNAKKESP
jgi:hypothetical protein